MSNLRVILALQAILEEVAGASTPFSADSYLPPHLVHDAMMAIEDTAGDDSTDQTQWLAQEQILLNRLLRADEMIKFLLQKNSELAQRVQFYERRNPE